MQLQLAFQQQRPVESPLSLGLRRMHRPHLQECLFYQAENTDCQKDLDQVDRLVADNRDLLTRTKQARDALRMDNIRLRGRCGLLGQESLLRDFEERRDEVNAVRRHVLRVLTVCCLSV